MLMLSVSASPGCGAVDRGDSVAGAPVDERPIGEPIKESHATQAGALTIIAPTVTTAEVRPLRAVSLATLGWRIISTSPSAVLGIAVKVPARTDRAAASASMASDLPLLRRERRSARSRLNDSMPAASHLTW